MDGTRSYRCFIPQSNGCLIFYDGNWYIGIILECPYENQDCSIKFMKRNSLNLHWISDMCFSCCRVTFKNLICIIDLPQAVSSSG